MLTIYGVGSHKWRTRTFTKRVGSAKMPGGEGYIKRKQAGHSFPDTLAQLYKNWFKFNIKNNLTAY